MNPPPDAPRDARTGFWVTLLAALGCFVIFLVVLLISYVPKLPKGDEVDITKIPAEEQWKYTPKGRQLHLDEMRAHERTAQTTYAWIDKGKGVVQLPIDRAMELTLRDLNAARQR